MGKSPNLPGAGDKPTDRDVSDFLAGDGDPSLAVPDDWDDVGRHAQRHDETEKPRRKQMNVDIDAAVRAQFKRLAADQGVQMRFVVEDLVRLYLSRMEADN